MAGTFLSQRRRFFIEHRFRHFFLCVPLLLATSAMSLQAATVGVLLNDGDCSPREVAGLPDLEPCSGSDPTFVEKTFTIEGVNIAEASASLTSGALRARTETFDLDTDIADAQTTAIGMNTYRLGSPSGQLPTLVKFARLEISGFANSANNGDFSVEAVELPNESYVLNKSFGGAVGPNESGVAITLTRRDSSRPSAFGRVEGLVLNYSDDNPFELGVGKFGIAFEVNYQRFGVPAVGSGIDFEIGHETLVSFTAFLGEPGEPLVLFQRSVIHTVKIEEVGGIRIEEESLSFNPLPPSAPPPLMEFFETERSLTRLSGRLENSVPISFDDGDTLRILIAFFRVTSEADLKTPGEPVPLPIAVSNGLTTAQFFGDFPPGLVAETSVPIDWPTEPPSPEPETLEVNIDIKPGSDPNCFNVNGHGVVPVAILGSAGFDVTAIDLDSLSFGSFNVRLKGNTVPMCSLDWIDDDDQLDLICQFEDSGSENWTPGDGFAVLTGSLFDGTMFSGDDSICLKP